MPQLDLKKGDVVRRIRASHARTWLVGDVALVDRIPDGEVYFLLIHIRLGCKIPWGAMSDVHWEKVDATETA